MGFKGTPATFQHLMNLILCGLHWTSVLVYLYGILILCTFLSGGLASAKQGLLPAKTGLNETEIKLVSLCEEVSRISLCHVVSIDGVHTDPAKTERMST